MLVLPDPRGPLLRRLSTLHVLDLPLERPAQNQMPDDATTTGDPLMARRPMPRRVHDASTPTVTPSPPDVLGVLGDREGWDAAPGGNGWRHAGLDVTVVQAGTYAFDVITATGTRRATSATGALCIVDQIAARAAE